MILVIVESPAKAKTINKYLGSEYKVLASMGHVRDLPAKSGSIVTENDFEMLWKTNTTRSNTLTDIKKEVKNSDKIILATDPDREGEAISWHLNELFNPKDQKEFERVVFNAVTKETVLSAIKKPRKIDMDLVEAYKARLSLDYLIGFTISPVLWKKLPGAKSAGRVQSVALKMICNRELDIETFKSQRFWTISADFQTKQKAKFKASLISRNGEKIERFDIKSEREALEIKNNLAESDFRVTEVKKTTIEKKPLPPFTTSTLQQEASKRLRFNPNTTMQIAQRLYEGIESSKLDGGLITYMRTDGVQIDDNVINDLREVIVNKYGTDQAPKNKNVYKTKSKNAQESHEAIRPTSIQNTPDEIRAHLTEEQYQLYDMIWKRTVASQMSNAKFERIAVSISTQDKNGIEHIFRANSQNRIFAGYQAVFDDDQTDGLDKVSEDDINENNKTIPVTEDESLSCLDIMEKSHDTEPPPRYNAASLIKGLEELGIGRPSTYASILTKLSDRNYTVTDQRRIIPTSNGKLVTAFLENYYPEYVQYDFTADLENKLDKISNGDFTRISLLEDFWKKLDTSTKGVEDVERKEVVNALNDTLAPYIFDQSQENPRLCPSCNKGELTLLSFKTGSFVGCTSYPDCKFQRDLSAKADSFDGEKIIAIDPDTNKNIILKNGRYGPYLELEMTDVEEKPKRTSIPKEINIDQMNEEIAIKLIALPRLIGNHPETQEEIIAAIGPYGPYIKHQSTYVNKLNIDDFLSIGLNRAITLIEEKDSSPRSGSKSGKNSIIGKFPNTNDDIILSSGRFGPYLKYKKKNYSLGKNISVETLNLEEAIKIIDLKDKKN